MGHSRCSPLDPDYPIPPVRLPQRPVTKPSLSESFRTRMLYSCLVDADYLDTERFMKGDMPRGTGDSPETLLTRLQAGLPKPDFRAEQAPVSRSCERAFSAASQSHNRLRFRPAAVKRPVFAFALHHAVNTV